MNILREIGKTIIRFPFVMGACLIGVFVFMYALEYPNVADNLINFFLTVALALPVFTVIALFFESRKIKLSYKLIANFVGLLLLVGVYFLMPEDMERAMYAYIYIPISLVFWVVAFLSAYLNKNEHSNFLKFSYTVIFHSAIKYILCMIVFIGLMVAVMAIKMLFEFEIDHQKILAYLGSIIFGLGLPTLILMNVPRNFRELTEPKVFSIIVKFVSKFVLFPLIGIYFLIIYSYALKIIFIATWPEGIVGTMVLAFVSLALFTMLISWPYYIKTKVRHMFTGIYIAIMPMAILLMLAVGVRIAEYGVTESRYYVMLSGIVFILISTYYLISQVRFNWKFVLMGVSIIVLITTCGPWGAVSMAKSSQIDRLTDKLEEMGLYRDGQIVRADETIYYNSNEYGVDSESSGYQVIQDINYLSRNYSPEALTDLLGDEFLDYKFSSDYIEKKLNIMSKYDKDVSYPGQN